MPRDNTIRRICRLNELTTYPLANSDNWVDSTEFNSSKKAPHAPTSSVATRSAAAVVASVTTLPQVPAASPFQRVGVRAGGYSGARESESGFGYRVPGIGHHGWGWWLVTSPSVL